MIAAKLKEAGRGIVQDLRTSFAEKDVNASGRLSRSLRSVVEEKPGSVRMFVDANGYVFEVEEGTPPPGKGGPRVFVADILKWLDDRSIRTAASFGDRDAMAYVITRKINAEGTTRYRTGKKTGAISDVINDDLIREIERQLADDILADAIEVITQTTRNGDNN